jgi:hypothetical protein
LDDKSDTDHTHNTTHNHNGLYSPTTHLHDDNYAEKTHTHDTSHKHDDLYQPKGNYALEGHTHEGGGDGGSGGGVSGGDYLFTPSTQDIQVYRWTQAWENAALNTDPTGTYLLDVCEGDNNGHIALYAKWDKGLGFSTLPEWKNDGQVRKATYATPTNKVEMRVDAIEEADEQTISRLQRCYNANGNPNNYVVRIAFRRKDYPETWLAGFHTPSETRYWNPVVFHLPVVGRSGGGIPVETTFDEKAWEEHLANKEEDNG